MMQQKAQLHKQREDYVKKLSVLQRELELLRNQKNELQGTRSPPRDLDSIVKENEKLQVCNSYTLIASSHNIL